MLAKRNFYGEIAIGILAILIIFSLMPSSINADTTEFQKVDQNKIPDELAMLATVTKNNYEKIKTWQGKISFEDMIIYRGSYAAELVKLSAGVTIEEPNELAAIAEGTRDFKIDLERNILFKSMNRPKPMEYINLDTGLHYTPLSSSYETKKITDKDYEIESSPYTFKKDGTITGWLAEKKRRYPEQDIEESDPRFCFSIGKMPWVLLPMMSEGVRRYNKDPNGTDANGRPNSAFSNVILEKAQTEKGAIYRVLINSTFEMKYTFEEKSGFNPTHIESKNTKGIKISEGDTDWVKIQDIFLPAEQQVTQYDGKDGRLRRQVKSIFSDMQVNMALPENTFSINNLGLKNGDKFVDKIESKEYKYQDANLVPIEDISAPAGGKKETTVAEPNK